MALVRSSSALCQDSGYLSVLANQHPARLLHKRPVHAFLTLGIHLQAEKIALTSSALIQNDLASKSALQAITAFRRTMRLKGLDRCNSQVQLAEN
jgi:hypothetical protein